jgi:hypothetical protein
VRDKHRDRRDARSEKRRPARSRREFGRRDITLRGDEHP